MNSLNEGRPREACLPPASPSSRHNTRCLGVRSLLSTPAHSPPSFHTEQSQPSQQQPPFAPDPLTPGPADFDNMPPNLPDHYADLKALMSDTTAKESTAYRHGQTNVLREFPRFDQASRPIVSDNWRAKSAVKSAATGPDRADRADRPQLGALMTGNPAALTPAVLSPSRSPLHSPSHDIRGFSQQNNNHSHHNPPPTPVSLSTPIKMAFPGQGFGHPSPFGNNYSPSVSSGGGGDTGQNIPGGGGMNFRGANNGFNSSNNNNNVTTMAPHPMTPSPDILGYCFIRPDGSRTRLVPVDMLPFQLEGIPPRENNNRLMPLPVPTGVGFDGRSTNTQLLFAINIPGNNSNGVDLIQFAIDRIIAASPSPPAFSFHPLAAAAGAAGSGRALTTTRFQPQQQQQQLTTTTGGGGGGGQPKRMKIYCDKWVHEGVCAFTQQGCKYKHEMPTDRATQHALGLFLGYPAWWKRRQAELSRVVPVPVKDENEDGKVKSGGAHQTGVGGSHPAEGSSRVAPAGPGTGASDHGRTSHSGFSSADIPTKKAEEVKPIFAIAGIGAGRMSGNTIKPDILDQNNRASAFWDLPVRPAMSEHEAVPKMERESRPSCLGIVPRARHDYNLRAAEVYYAAQNRANAAAAATAPSSVPPSKGVSAWPWHQQHYAHRDSPAPHMHIQVQTEQRAQSQPNQQPSNAASACVYEFHPTLSTSPGPSPYGPIAPPPRTNNAAVAPASTAANDNDNGGNGSGRTVYGNY